MIKELIEKLRPDMDREMPKEWGTFNTLCPNCLRRDGHNLIYCYSCGTKTVKYDHHITWKNYIDRALTDRERAKRFRGFLYRHGYAVESKAILRYEEKLVLEAIRETGIDNEKDLLELEELKDISVGMTLCRLKNDKIEYDYEGWSAKNIRILGEE